MHYYERWAAHEKSQLKAFADLRDTADNKLRTLSVCQSTPANLLKFITDGMVGDATAGSHKPSLGRRLCPGTLTRGVRGAQAQIMDCRRVLKWTYGYGYYASITPVQRNLFEFMQGHAEQTLEKLTHVVEVDLERFLCTEPQVGRQTASARTPSPNWRQNVEKRLVVSERALRERLSVLGYKRTVVRVCIRGREPCYQ
jgi:ariadne-1